MKRIFIVITILTTACVATFAQAQYSLTTYKSLKNKLEKSNKNILDAKKKVEAKTWFERAKLMTEIGDVSTQFLSQNMPLTEVKIFFKEPREIKKVTEKEGNTVQQIEQYIYDYFTLNIANNKVVSWMETNLIIPGALDSAVECYNITKKLDAKEKYTKKIAAGLKALTPIYQKNALNYYALKDYKGAYKAFKAIVNIDNTKGIDVQDTVFIYYTGVFASEAGFKDEAIPYLVRAKNLNYKEPNLYVYLSNDYLAKKDSASALSSLQEGFTKFPESAMILNQLINYYLSSGESKKALSYLDKAIQKDPKNKSYYFAQGTLYDKLDSVNLAVDSYGKALQIDPNYYDANFNLAVVYYNHALKLMEIANDEMDNTKFEKKKEIADSVFKKAIPYMEKAHEISPKDRQPLETLKTLYYRLKMMDQLDRVKKLLDDLNK